MSDEHISHARVSKQTITEINADQGICGFTSALCSVYDHRADLRGRLGHALGPESNRHHRMQAEIKSFLMLLKAEVEVAANKPSVPQHKQFASPASGHDCQKLLKDISSLTKSLSGDEKWDMDAYIRNIDTLVANDYSIALPKDALMAYLDIMWDLRSTHSSSDQPGEAIIGLAQKAHGKDPRRELVHYVYRDGSGNIHNWGETMAGMEALNQQMFPDPEKPGEVEVAFQVSLHSIDASAQQGAHSSGS